MEKIAKSAASQLGWGAWIVFLLLGVFVLVPMPLVNKFYLIGFGICPQRPSHSYFLGENMLLGETVVRAIFPVINRIAPNTATKMPVEARMYGMFAGFLVTWLYSFWRGRGHAAGMPSPLIMLAYVSFIAIMGVDGGNATMYDIHNAGVPIPYVYVPRLDVRFITGWLSGIGMAGIVLPAVNYVLWKYAEAKPMFDRLIDLLPLLLMGAVILVLLTTGSGLFFYPLAVLAPLGILATLGALNVVLVLTLGHRERFAANWGEALNPVALALCFALVELGALSLMRFAAFGFGEIG